MNPLNLIKGAYDRPARLYPALLLAAPAIATLVANLSVNWSALQSLGATLVGFGGSFLLTELARDAGKDREPLLFKLWGGMPSVLIFRHSHTQLDSITKARYHKRLASLVKGAKAPTAAEEQANPAAADEIYSSWSHYLRVNTRDVRKYPLIFQENISYGYRRNVWGLRKVGIITNLLCCAVSGVHLCLIYSHNEHLDEKIGGALAVSLVFLLLWLFRFTSTWVRIPANAYAERLVESVETFGSSSGSGKKSA